MTILSFRDLVLRTPDGRPLLDDATATLQSGVTALVGANGAGKSTLLRTLAGGLAPTAGQVDRRGLVRLVAPQASRGALALALQALPAELHGAAGGIRREVARLLPPALDPEHASPGESARAWLACLAAGEADAWLLDEPSAHLDAEGRAWLKRWLGRCRVPVLVASHDRDLLGSAAQTWELVAGGLRRWGGGFDDYLEDAASARERAGDAVRRARREQQAVALQAQQARERADRRAATGKAQVRGGSQGRLLGGYLQGRAERGGGARERAAAARLAAAAAALAQAREGVAHAPDFRLDVSGGRVAAEQRLLRVQGLGLQSGGRWLLRDWSLQLVGPRRLAVPGPNGCGKSSLLRVLAGREHPAAGRVERGALSVALVDQSSAPQPGETALDAFLRAQPMSEAEARERLAWFLFRGGQVLQPVASLSSGERVRLGLACQLGGPRQPGLLLLDEPDNHLDLPSLRAVEHALSQFRGGLLVVSHDARFLEAIGLEGELACDWTLARTPAS